MKQRCNNPHNSQYTDYGGRGITYPPKWETFAGFKEDMENGYSDGLTIDRINNNESYSKENCQWATWKQQNNNKRSNIVLTYKNETLPLSLWASKLGLQFNVIRSRYYRGWPVDKILATTRFHRFGIRH